MNNTRRRLLVSMMLVGAGGASFWYWSKKRHEIVFSKDFHNEIIKVVGMAYLEKFPSEENTKHLQSELFGSGDFFSREDVVRHLTARIEADFTNSETVYLDGWLLSRTEVRFAALAALTDRVSL